MHHHMQTFLVSGIREGDPQRWSTVLVTALVSWGKHIEGDPQRWSAVLVTALGSWKKTVRPAARTHV